MVAIPVSIRFLPLISSRDKSPPTTRSPPTVTIPANAALPLCCMVERPTVIPIPVVWKIFVSL